MVLLLRTVIESKPPEKIGVMFSAETVKAVAGAHNINAEEETQQELRLRKFTRHPFFDKDTLRFDVATISFSNTFSLNQYVQVCRSHVVY